MLIARNGSIRWAVWSEGFWRDGQAKAGGGNLWLPGPHPLDAPARTPEMTNPSATETIALKAMRAARDDNGWHEESLLVDVGAEALMRDGIAKETARVAAQLVFNTHFKNWAGVL